MHGGRPDRSEPTPVEGVTYRAAVLPSGRVQLEWKSKRRDAWMRVLGYVRALKHRTYDSVAKKWTVPHTPEDMAAIAKLGFVEGGNAPAQERVSEAREHDRLARLARVVPSYVRDYALAPERVPDYDVAEGQRRDIECEELDMEREIIPGLRGYQLDFLKFMQTTGGRALLMDEAGTGKTLQALAYMTYMDDFPALYVVNAPTKMQWKREYYRWVSRCPSCVCSCKILSGMMPVKLDNVSSYVINYDILSAWLPSLRKVGFRLLVGDEVQAIGNPKSQRAKAFRELAKSIPHVVCMSGTPARSRPAQFWTCLNIADPDSFPSYEGYLYRYCDPKKTTFGVTFNGLTNGKELYSMLARVTLRRTKEQVMKELPPKTYSVVPLETDAAVMRQYAAEERELASMTSTKAMREHLAGMMSTAYAAKEKSLLKWVEDFLEGGEKLLLFAWHRDAVDVLCDSLKKYRPAKIYGGTDLKAREAEKARFVDDPSCRVIVGNIQSLGTGVDGLQAACCNVAFAEFSYTPTDMEQAASRLWRSGQSRPVTVHYLIAPGTVDDDSVEVLDSRTKMLSAVMDGKSAADCDLISEVMARMGLHPTE